jgi:DNA-binding MarR family transcriptional regulator
VASADADTRELPRLLTTLGVLLATRGQEALRVLTSAYARVGLKPRQVQAVVLLAERGGMTQRELGEVMAVDPSILVGLLNPLEEEGLISRQRDACDRRRHNILLTRKGRQRVAEVEREQAAAEDAYFAELEAGERDQLRELLSRATAQLDDIAPGGDDESVEAC